MHMRLLTAVSSGINPPNIRNNNNNGIYFRPSVTPPVVTKRYLIVWLPAQKLHKRKSGRRVAPMTTQTPDGKAIDKSMIPPNGAVVNGHLMKEFASARPVS